MQGDIATPILNSIVAHTVENINIFSADTKIIFIVCTMIVVTSGTDDILVTPITIKYFGIGRWNVLVAHTRRREALPNSGTTIPVSW